MSDSQSIGGDLVTLVVSLAREASVGYLGVWLPLSRGNSCQSREDGGSIAILPSREAAGMRPLPDRSSEGCFWTRVLDRVGVPRWAHVAAQTE